MKRWSAMRRLLVRISLSGYYALTLGVLALGYIAEDSARHGFTAKSWLLLAAVVVLAGVVLRTMAKESRG